MDCLRLGLRKHLIWQLWGFVPLNSKSGTSFSSNCLPAGENLWIGSSRFKKHFAWQRDFPKLDFLSGGANEGSNIALFLSRVSSAEGENMWLDWQQRLKDEQSCRKRRLSRQLCRSHQQPQARREEARDLVKYFMLPLMSMCQLSSSRRRHLGAASCGMPECGNGRGASSGEQRAAPAGDAADVLRSRKT